MLRDHIARREGHDPILVVDEQIAGVARELADTLPGQERASVPLVAWHDFNPEAMRAVNAASDPSLIADDKPVALFSRHVNPVGEMASYIDRLRLLGRRNPVVLHLSYTGLDAETTGILAGADFGALLLDGYGAGIWIDSEGVDRQKLTDISLAILQAARLRFTRTEYIACPGCGHRGNEGPQDRRHGLHSQRSRRDGRRRLWLRGGRTGPRDPLPRQNTRGQEYPSGRSRRLPFATS